MKVRFEPNVNFDERIVRGVLRLEPAIDILPAAEASLHGLPDWRVLEIAADEGRVLVTHDRKTIPYDFGKLISKRTSPGVLITPQEFPIPPARYEILLIWMASTAEEWEGMLVQFSSPPLSNR